MRRHRLIPAFVVFVAIMLAFWLVVEHLLRIPAEVNVPRTFAAFVLLFVPLWFFGFGAAEGLKRLGQWPRIFAPAVLSVAYFAFAVGTPRLHWRAAVIVIALPVLLAAFLELPQLPSKMTLRDGAAIAIIVAVYFAGWLRNVWPSPSLALFPKLFLADIALYCFLVIRKVEGAGYSLVPARQDLHIGLREWMFYFPIALVLGEFTGFIHFHPILPSAVRVLGAVLFTFFLVALPEELFFRAILQNLLETRIGRIGALFVASALFGLSHFNHGSVFNWRYVTLAAIAGVFYGRAWRAERRVLASIITHTAVDVVWTLWFR